MLHDINNVVNIILQYLYINKFCIEILQLPNNKNIFEHIT